MTAIPYQPLVVHKGAKRDLRTQFGAVCYRMKKGKLQILLVTSRQRKRWIIPKGWPANGMTPAEAAAREAWEEGGVIGKTDDICLGMYDYTKEMDDTDDLPCIVAVFPVKVRKLSDDYPERKLRRRQWLSPKKAAKLVSEPALKALLARFTPPKTA